VRSGYDPIEHESEAVMECNEREDKETKDGKTIRGILIREYIMKGVSLLYNFFFRIAYQ